MVGRCDDRMMDKQDEYERPYGYVFAVADSPHCCWDFDHGRRTLEFLDGIDPDHFGTVASLLSDQLETDDAMAASIALRVSYHQGLETLMSLLGAAAQAPSAVPAWIATCKTEDLNEVTARLRDGRPLLTQSGRQRVSFVDLSEDVHRSVWIDEEGESSTAELFARFWGRLSTEFLDETARAEYNALKHGNRVVAGGFTLAMGTEEVPGVPAPPEAMRSMGGSRFGSTFFVSERVGSSRLHIRTRRTSINWSPQALVQRLVLVSMSITNVVGALRCSLGIDSTTVRFVRPYPLSAFDDVWSSDPGPKSMGLDTVIRIDPSDELSKDQLLSVLEGRDDGSNDRDPGGQR